MTAEEIMRLPVFAAKVEEFTTADGRKVNVPRWPVARARYLTQDEAIFVIDGDFNRWMVVDTDEGPMRKML